MKTRIALYSFDRAELKLYAHILETYLHAEVTACYDSFTLRESMPGQHCAVIVRNSGCATTVHKTAGLISAMRRTWKIAFVPIVLVDLQSYLNIHGR